MFEAAATPKAAKPPPPPVEVVDEPLAGSDTHFVTLGIEQDRAHLPGV